MKMGWRMRRERMTDGLTTYFFVCFFYFVYYNFIRTECFCRLERYRSEFGGGGVT